MMDNALSLLSWWVAVAELGLPALDGDLAGSVPATHPSTTSRSHITSCNWSLHIAVTKVAIVPYNVT